MGNTFLSHNGVLVLAGWQLKEVQWYHSSWGYLYITIIEGARAPHILHTSCCMHTGVFIPVEFRIYFIPRGDIRASKQIRVNLYRRNPPASMYYQGMPYLRIYGRSFMQDKSLGHHAVLGVRSSKTIWPSLPTTTAAVRQ